MKRFIQVSFILAVSLSLGWHGKQLFADTLGTQTFSSYARIKTIAGSGASAGFAGDGQSALLARFSTAFAVAADSTGNVFIADWGNRRVRRVAPDGLITTYAGTGDDGFTGDGGPATLAKLGLPTDVAVDSVDNLYVVDASNHCIRKITAAHIISTYAGICGQSGFTGDGGSATAAHLNNPTAIAIDSTGRMFIADTFNRRIRVVGGTQIISTVAGSGVEGVTGDGASALAAAFLTPQGIAVSSDGSTVYVSDSTANRVRKFTVGGNIVLAAGSSLAGGYGGDGGPGTAALLTQPAGLTITNHNDLVIADSGNQRLRMLNPDGTIQTIAGTGTAGFAGDGGHPATAQFSTPYDVAWSGSGLLVVDQGNIRVRLIFEPHLIYLPMLLK